MSSLDYSPDARRSDRPAIGEPVPAVAYREAAPASVAEFVATAALHASRNMPESAAIPADTVLGQGDTGTTDGSYHGLTDADEVQLVGEVVPSAGTDEPEACQEQVSADKRQTDPVLSAADAIPKVGVRPGTDDVPEVLPVVNAPSDTVQAVARTVLTAERQSLVPATAATDIPHDTNDRIAAVAPRPAIRAEGTDSPPGDSPGKAAENDDTIAEPTDSSDTARTGDHTPAPEGESLDLATGGGDGVDGTDGEMGSGDEDPAERALRAAVDGVRARAARSWAANDTPRVFTARIPDPADSTGRRTLVVRLIPPDMEDIPEAERDRREALRRSLSIDRGQTHINLDEPVVLDDDPDVTIVRPARGKDIRQLTVDERAQVDSHGLVSLLDGLAIMAEQGVTPNTGPGTVSVVWDTETRRIGIRGYVPLDESVMQESGFRIVTDPFDKALNVLIAPGDNDREVRKIGDRFKVQSVTALRRHFFYKAPSIAIATEYLTPELVDFMYDRAAPVRQNTITSKAHAASRMHDLALSSVGTVRQRLATLRASQQAYRAILYKDRFSAEDRSVTRVLRTGQRGIAITSLNEAALQSRLALAFMPVSEARIRGEPLSWRVKAEVNTNLAAALDEMLSGGTLASVLGGRESMVHGFLNETVGMTLLTRQNKDINTPVALPTSEVRRQHAGPDAAVPFNSPNGRREVDIDWKIRLAGGSPYTYAGDVLVGTTCFEEIATMKKPPDLDGDDEYIQVRNAMVYAAKLLRDEGLAVRELTQDETDFLNRVQAKIWKRIVDTARNNYGVSNLDQQTNI